MKASWVIFIVLALILLWATGVLGDWFTPSHDLQR